MLITPNRPGLQDASSIAIISGKNTLGCAWVRQAHGFLQAWVGDNSCLGGEWQEGAELSGWMQDMMKGVSRKNVNLPCR